MSAETILSSYTHARARTRTHSHTHTHSLTHTHTHARARTHAHACTRMHTHAHACTRMHTHARTHAHTHIHTHAQLKKGGKQRLEMDEDSSTEQKTLHVYNFGKSNVIRLNLNESRENFCRRGRGRSFHVDGPKTEKAQEPTVECHLGLWSTFGHCPTIT